MELQNVVSQHGGISKIMKEARSPIFYLIGSGGKSEAFVMLDS